MNITTLEAQEEMISAVEMCLILLVSPTSTGGNGAIKAPPGSGPELTATQSPPQSDTSGEGAGK